MKQQTTTQQPIYDARTLGAAKMAILGLQHMFAMFRRNDPCANSDRDLFLENGASYGLSIQVTLLFAGLGTLFFHLCSKFQIPAFWDHPLHFWVVFNDCNTGYRYFCRHAHE